MRQLYIFSATRGKKEDTLLYKSMKKLNLNLLDTGAFVFKENNTDGLSKCYNDFIKAAIDFSPAPRMICFIHDDVELLSADIFTQLPPAHKEYDLVGLAGGFNSTIQAPALWHIMCGGFNSGNLRGAVAHKVDDKRIMMTSFGPTPDRVVLIDGLFMSVNLDRIRSVAWQFNENYTFHHYDIASCLDAHKKKLKIGVWPIFVSHASPGLRSLEDPTFLANQAKFLAEYS